MAEGAKAEEKIGRTTNASSLRGNKPPSFVHGLVLSYMATLPPVALGGVPLGFRSACARHTLARKITSFIQAAVASSLLLDRADLPGIGASANSWENNKTPVGRRESFGGVPAPWRQIVRHGQG
jgi:hypothetical protein